MARFLPFPFVLFSSNGVLNLGNFFPVQPTGASFNLETRLLWLSGRHLQWQNPDREKRPIHLQCRDSLVMVVGCSLSLTCMCCSSFCSSGSISFTSPCTFCRSQPDGKSNVGGSSMVRERFPSSLSQISEMVEGIHPPGHLSRIVFCKVFFISI